MVRIKNFIDGKFLDSVTTKTLDSINPATEKVIGTLPDSSKEDVHIAVASAKAAFNSWSILTPQVRSNYLNKIANLIDENLDELAHLESIDQGKPLWLAKSVDIPRAASNFRFYASAILQESSEFFKTSETTFNYSLRQAVGVCGLISPWNLPLYLLSWKIAPAIAVGNTCVAKPSEFTSMTAHKLCELIEEAGVPNGVVNIIFGLGQNVGNALTSHPDVNLISFTGGTATGKKVYQNAIQDFKKVSLELGGKNPTIIFDDCDYEKALNTTVRSSFTNQGEICLCGSRIYIQQTIYNKFLVDLVARTKQLIIGDPLNSESKMGAIVSKQHYEKVRSYIDIAKEEGGVIETGGKRPSHLETGYFLEPTIISGLKQNSRCVNEEIFGPVVVVIPFTDDADVLEKANDSNYGLATNLWTSNLNRAHTLASKIDTGIVWVNTWMMRDLRTAFGGMKHSGVGREGGRYSLEFYTKVKNICIEN